MSKLAILNCDDFGMSSRINQGVLEAHNRGVLNSTTLLVNHRAAFEAAAIARDNPELGVGLHLDLEALFNFKASVYYGKSVSDVKSNTLALVLKQQSLIEDMIIEQVEKFKYLNLNMTHLDGHNHVHLFPGVFEIVVEQIQQLGIKKIRFFRDFYEQAHDIYARHKRILDEQKIEYVNDFHDFSFFFMNKFAGKSPVEIMVHVEHSTRQSWRSHQLNWLLSDEMAHFLHIENIAVSSYEHL